MRFELEDAAAWCLDWANSEVIAVGCSNGESPCSGRTLTMASIDLPPGYVAVFDVAEALKNPENDEGTHPSSL